MATVRELAALLTDLGGEIEFRRGDRGHRLLSVACGLDPSASDGPWRIRARPARIDVLMAGGRKFQVEWRDVADLAHDDPRVLPPVGMNT